MISCTAGGGLRYAAFLATSNFFANIHSSMPVMCMSLLACCAVPITPHVCYASVVGDWHGSVIGIQGLFMSVHDILDSRHKSGILIMGLRPCREWVSGGRPPLEL